MKADYVREAVFSVWLGLIRSVQGEAKERELSLVREVLSGLIGGALAALS